MIKWNGKSTDGAWKQEIIAKNHEELLETMIEKDICESYSNIHSQAFNELCDYFNLLQDLREDYEEALENEDDEMIEYIEMKINTLDWHKEIFSKLTDEEFEQVIRCIDGIAYYQEFEQL